MVKQLLRTGANNLAAKTQQKKKARENKGKTEMTPLQRKMRAMQGEMSDSPTSQKPFKRHEEVQDLKFSPDGSKLAVASRDNNIYIYNCLTDDGDFQIIGVCRGHSSYVTHIDWSEDSTSLQSNDGTYELLYWDANTAKQVREITTYNINNSNQEEKKKKLTPNTFFFFLASFLLFFFNIFWDRLHHRTQCVMLHGIRIHVQWVGLCKRFGNQKVMVQM